MTGVIEAGGLVVSLGARRVLDAVDCRFARGWTAIVGPNGAGKSTLLRALAGLVVPSAGRIVLDGTPLADIAPAERGRRVAWLAQAGDVSGELDVHETVALGRLPHIGLFAGPGVADERAIGRAMAATGCGAWSHRPLGSLSGGERQRVLLARALATEAPTLLFDEPTTHLDPPHQVAVVRLLRMLAADHTVVTVLHDLSLALHADRVLVLGAGKVAIEAAYDDARLHRALVDVFDGAVRIAPDRDGAGRRPIALPNIEP